MDGCTCDAFCDSPCPVHANEEEKAAWDGGLGDLEGAYPDKPPPRSKLLAEEDEKP